MLTDAILKKHMFVKVHMIYKKVRSRHNEGKLFEALSQFYLALYSPGGVHGAGVNSKLMRDVLKVLLQCLLKWSCPAYLSSCDYLVPCFVLAHVHLFTPFSFSHDSILNTKLA